MNEILFSFQANKTCYLLIFNKTGQVFRSDTNVFESYLTANYSLYSTSSATQQGTASPFYEATFPAAISNGDYQVVAKQQIGGSTAETDPTIATGNFAWTGSQLAQISDLVTSGQLGIISPIRLARGTQILNFPVFLRSSSDHVTPFTSGVVSGQISRDGGAFGVLQSGSFTEVGQGFYRTTLTSGDILANTVALVFTANGISGGTSDPLPLAFITQRVSGQL